MPTVDIWTPPSANQKDAFYEHEYRIWQRTPGFRDMPRRDLPMNPYKDEGQQIKQIYFTGAIIRSPNGSISYLSGYEPQYLYTRAQIDSEWRSALSTTDYATVSEELGNELKLKLLNQIAETKTNVGVMAAEARKTSQTIVDSAQRVAFAMSAVRRGNFAAVADLLNLSKRTNKPRHKDFLSDWLAYKYGWMPILMDVKGTAELFAQQWALNGRPPRFSVQVRGDSQKEYNMSENYVPWGGSSPTARRDKRLYFNQERRLKVWVEVTSQSLTAAQQAGLTNPALVAWELVPYSFVFDWFYSVGSWLNALTALHGLSIVKSMDEVMNEYYYVRSEPQTVQTDSGGTTRTNSPYHVSSKTRDYSRNPVSFSMLPPLPQLKNPFPDIPKMVTSLALLRGQVRGVSSRQSRG